MVGYPQPTEPVAYADEARAAKDDLLYLEESRRERMEMRTGIDRTEVFRRRRDVFKPQFRK